MNRKPPALRRHASGQYFVRWGGRDHYLGHDAGQAQKDYLSNLTKWVQWRGQRDVVTAPKAVPSTVFEIATRFLDHKEAEGGAERRRYWNNHLRRFIAGYRNIRADEIRPVDLHQLRDAMLKSEFSPRNIQHDLMAVKAMLKWAASLEWIPQVNLDAIKAPMAAPVPDKAYSVAEVWAFVLFCSEDIANWLTLQYLTLMRPSEVVRVVMGEGEWDEPWLFRLGKSKMAWRTQEYRRIVFSDAALSFLHCCRPLWSRYDTYYQAVRREVHGTDFGQFSPHPLRHSGATHLAQAGVARSDIDLLLGHLPSRVSRTYNRIDWESLREPVARISQGTVGRIRP